MPNNPSVAADRDLEARLRALEMRLEAVQQSGEVVLSMLQRDLQTEQLTAVAAADDEDAGDLEDVWGRITARGTRGPRGHKARESGSVPTRHEAHGQVLAHGEASDADEGYAEGCHRGLPR